MSQAGAKNEFPNSVIETIKNEISFNAPLRTISTLIPISSIRFGKDCIQLHNAIIRQLFKDPDMKLGDRIVGTPGSTHQILRRQGKAGPLKVFSFFTKAGKQSTGNATAHKLMESVGDYVIKQYGGNGVSIYGVSALDGYHSMLLTYQKKNGQSEFVIIDQGPATSYLSGKLTAHSSKALDEALTDYIRDKQEKRTAGGYQFPANIQIYKINPDTDK
jgi:hypothetical protein